MKLILLASHTKIDRWVYEMLGDLLDIPDLRVTKVLLLPHDATGLKALYRRYSSLEKRLFRASPDALQQMELASLFPEGTLHRPSAEEWEQYKKQSRGVPADLALALDPGVPVNAAQGLTSHGILFIHFGALGQARTAWPGAREMLSGADTAEAHLIHVAHSDTSAWSSLGNVTVGTDKISIRRTAQNLLWTASAMVPRILRKISLEGTGTFMAALNTMPGASVPESSPLWQPAIGYFLQRLFLKYLLKTKQQLLSYFIYEQWILLYAFGQESPASELQPARFKRLLPPKDRFWADPFIFLKDDIYYLFFEELVYADKKGHLSVMTLTKEGQASTPSPILKTDYHLSYPFLIEENGQLYMIPESSEKKNIQLYRCTAFPDRWEFVMELMTDVVAVDTTLIKKGSHYWMFTNLREREGASKNNELFLFSSESLLSTQWKPHPMNPVVSDATRARPGGAVFADGARLFRPAQDCGKYYGYATSVREISTLTETAYEERELYRLLPDWDPKIVATHTLNHAGELTVLDGILKRTK